MKSKWQRGAAIGWIILVIILLCIIGFLIWWFGFNNNSTSTTTSTTSQSTQPTDAQQKAAIKDNWTTFFDGSTPADKKVALLQNGQQYKQVIDQQSQSQTAKATSATVSNVKLTDDTSATVSYTIDINGQPQLKNQTGTAVKEDGIWKVSDTAFCSLLQLSGNVPPNCPGASSQPNQQSTNGQSTQPNQTQTQTQTNSQP